MVYLIGIIGFAAGFFSGQLILSHWLKDYDREDILAMMRDPGKRFKYGLFNWGVAIAGAVLSVWAYRYYFPE